MTSTKLPDPAAVQLTTLAFEKINPDAAVLFGSRARGDYDENRSDVDIMLIVETEHEQDQKTILDQWAQKTAQLIYGHQVPVQLVWFEQQEYKHQSKYVNTIVTRALRQGILMADNPEEYRSRYDDEETEYEYLWTDYDNRLYHAERHLNQSQGEKRRDMG